MKRYKVRQMLNLLREDGWVLLRTNGSHHQFAHPSKPGLVTISFHSGNDDLHPKTANSILKQAGLKALKKI